MKLVVVENNSRKEVRKGPLTAWIKFYFVSGLIHTEHMSTKEDSWLSFFSKSRGWIFVGNTAIHMNNVELIKIEED